MHILVMTLDTFLSDRRITNADFASRVGVDTASISRLRRRLFNPTLALMGRIHVATEGKVTPNDFLAETAPTTVEAAE